MRSSSALTLLIPALIAALTSPVGATEEDAKTFFAQGRQLRAGGNCTDAVVSFRRALEVFPQGLGALRNIAECEEQLGQFASARNDWWSLRRAVLQSNEPKYDGWEKDAEQGYERLAPKVAKLTIRLQGAETAQVRITLDGKPLDPRLVGVELERDLGPHTVEAFYGGAAPLVERRALGPGSREVVTLDIPATKLADGAAKPNAGSPPASGASSSSPPPVTPPPSGSSALRPAGFAALGVGGLGLIGTIASIVVRQGALAEIDRRCSSHENCPTDLIAVRDRGQTASTLASVFTGVAIVGVGAGITLVTLGAPASTTSPASPASPGATSTTATLGFAPLRNGGAAQIIVRY